MKKIAFLGLALSFFYASAFAVDQENCSNADGSLKRVEEEIWGENPVDWFYKGTKVTDPKIERNEQSKIVLDRSVRDTRGGRLEDSTYAIKLTLSRKDGEPLEKGSDVRKATDFVICQYHEDPYQD